MMATPILWIPFIHRGVSFVVAGFIFLPTISMPSVPGSPACAVVWPVTCVFVTGNESLVAIPNDFVLLDIDLNVNFGEVYRGRTISFSVCCLLKGSIRHEQWVGLSWKHIYYHIYLYSSEMANRPHTILKQMITQSSFALPYRLDSPLIK